MLSIARLTIGQETYYLTLAREDYYVAGGEPPGRWLGRGAEALGLSGKVEKLALQRLFAGVAADGSRFLVQHQQYTDGRHRQPAWDLSFSPDKTVSTLWSRVHPLVRELIERCHDDAVQCGFGYLEREAAFSRRGHGGHEAERCRLVAAKFEHGTSRAADPQLHTHVVVVNVGVRDDGTTGTIRSHDLYIHKMAAGALYRVELARLLQERLGLRLERGRVSFGIAGVPDALCEDFSKRRAEIEELGAATGAQGARAYEQLTLASRHVKGHVAREDLFPVWGGVADNYGFTEQRAHELLHRVPAREARELSLHKQVVDAIDSLIDRQSHFPERDVVRAVAQAVQHLGVPADCILSDIKEHLRWHQSIISLGTDPQRAYGQYTTMDHFAVEKELLERLWASAEDRAHAVDEADLERVVKRRPTIRDEQLSAVEHLTVRSGATACLVGMAGTGKTYVLDAAREAWERAGLKVVGCALAGRAAQQLEQSSGITSRTLEKTFRLLDPSAGETLIHGAKQFVKSAWLDFKLDVVHGLSERAKRSVHAEFERPGDRLELDSKTVVVLDEAGMVGTTQLTRLVRLVAKAGAKLVMVGDPDQLQPIEAGSPFRAAIERLGAARLTDIVRQYEEWMRDAVRQFAEGDARGALTQYALAGKLKLSENRVDAMRQLITEWRDHRTADLSETIILAGTQQEVDRLNTMAQQERDAARELRTLRTARRGEFERREAGHVVRHCAVELHEGDRVLFTRNDPRLGVFNGDLGTIERIRVSLLPGHTEITVRLDRQERMGLFQKHARATFTLKEYRDIDLGYAITTHKAQGGTFERSFVLGGGWMQDRELSYVQMSRAREETRLYVSEADAGEDLSALVSEMSRTRAKDLAHDVEARRESQGLTQEQHR